MKKVLALLVLTSISLFFIEPSVAQNDLADVIEQAEKSVLRIEVEGSQGDGLGSGYIVQDDGLFVTNVHVMAGASKAVAHFANGDTAKITGTYLIDENRDICVCQLEGNSYVPIAFSIDRPRKGASVIALGAPQGLSFSATTGIVSAIRGQEEARQQMGRPQLEGTWIQVDAALSPGNSGGPLINHSGEVVGMSTLASSGRAQNLNFGISAEDIATAVDAAKKQGLKNFEDGIAKVIMSDGGSGDSDSGSIIDPEPIPDVALQQYIATGKQQYRELISEYRKSASKAATKLREYKKGEAFLPRGAEGSDVAVLRGEKKNRYFFRNESIKKRQVKRQEELVKRQTSIRRKLTTEMDEESLVALLLNGGPVLDPRESKTIGFMEDATVVHAYNDHEVVVVYENVPFLMWIESTVGLAMGSPLDAYPVYVAGTQTFHVSGKGPRSLTVLSAVSESAIRQAVAGSSATSRSGSSNSISPLAEFRTWTDRTGKYTFEAIFVEAGAKQVVLKSRKDKIITVPLSKLSKDDLELIEQYKK